MMAISDDARLAEAFLATLENPRASWAHPFEIWADERGLARELRRSVRITVLRLRMFGAVARHRPRRKR